MKGGPWQLFCFALATLVAAVLRNYLKLQGGHGARVAIPSGIYLVCS